MTMRYSKIILTAASSANAAISYVKITNDADSGISSSSTYTHAIDFGTVASGTGPTVNGVTFALANHTVSNLAAAPFLNYNGNGNSGETSNAGTSSSATGANSTLSGNVAGLLGGFLHQNGSNAQVNVLQTITLSNLTVGTTYDLRLYFGSWGATSGRDQIFTFDPSGANESTPLIDVDDPTQIGLAQFDAWYINYRYTATSDQLVFRSQIQNNGFSTHYYALTNQVIPLPIPEPSTALLGGLSALLLLRRRR